MKGDRMLILGLAICLILNPVFNIASAYSTDNDSVIQQGIGINKNAETLSVE